MVKQTDIKIKTADQYTLAASLYENEKDSNKLVIIASATGVKKSYYQKYAEFLSAHGLNVLTFDYRGIGDSLHHSIHTSPGYMYQWGKFDLDAVIQYTEEHFGNSKVLFVGHSVGGQLLGLTPRNQRVSSALMVASQSGYWKHWPGHMKPIMAFLWYVLVPGLAKSLSYLPSQRLGFGENLPKGVAIEWARWCRNEAFFVSHDGEQYPLFFENLNIPIKAYCFTDDRLAPSNAVDALMVFYQNCSIERIDLTPQEISTNKIGHFGFFRQTMQHSLWKESLNWLNQEKELE